MANYTLDTIAFVSENEDGKLKELNDAMGYLLEHSGEKRVTLGDVVSRLGYRFENNTGCETYIECVEVVGDMLYVYSSSRRLPSLLEIEFISRMMDLQYYIKTSDTMRGLYINTDISGEVFPLRYTIEFTSEYKELENYYDEAERFNIIYSGGLGFDSLYELTEHFYEKYGVLFPEEAVNDIKKISKEIEKLNWKFDFPIRILDLSEEQVEYISNCIKAQK